MEKALELGPREAEFYPLTLREGARAALALGRLDQAGAYLEHAIQLRPDDADCRFLLGMTKEQQGQPDQALALYRQAGISLRVDASRAVTAPLDRTLFQRAVGNLIENALAHTPAGGTVTLSGTAREEVIEVSVTDTGAGIPAAEREHVFDRFRRADPSRSRHSGGLGLGLAIVKSIAALHGGQVRLESELGRGTRVTLVFPSQMTKT